MLKIQTLVMALSLGVLGASAAQAADVTGAGASFPAPVYFKWSEAYKKETGNQINYQSIGSGGGIKQITAKTVDFGATDAPLTPQELAEKGMVQFPTVIGGVVPVVNLPGVQPGQLKLTGDVLAKIYLGEITRWNDAAIMKLNPGVKIPDLAVGPVRRADGSGTTFIFTNYLSKVSPTWKEKVGEDKAVKWPVGLGGKGNEGVSAFVQRIPGSIGYVEYAYAKQNGLVHAQLQNKEGKFVSPEEKTFKSAAAYADWSKQFYEVLTNEPGADSWPITGATFILLHKTQDNSAKGTEILKFFDWAYSKGDKMAQELVYVPLPEETVKLVRDAWKSVKGADGKSIAVK